MTAIHEKYIDSEIIIGPSNRAFGFTMCWVLLLVAVLGMVKYELHIGTLVFYGILAISFGIFGVFAPSKLETINKIWSRFGVMLNEVMTPMVMLIIYLIAFVPIGALLRLTRRNSMCNFKTPGASYWLKKEQAKIKDPLKYQF